MRHRIIFWYATDEAFPISAGATRLRCFGDSDLVASQISGTCDATDANMIAYKRAFDQAGASFAGYIVEWGIMRKIEEAGTLSWLGSKRQPPPPGVFLDILTRPSMRPPSEIDIVDPPAPDLVLVAVASEFGDWMEPYMNYLERQILPMDEVEAQMIVRQYKTFTIINKELYKRNVDGIFQRCITPEDGRKILATYTGKLRPPCWRSLHRRQSLPSRLLLAHRPHRRCRARPRVHRVPEVCEPVSPARLYTQGHPPYRTLRHLGHRYGGKIQDGSRWLHTPPRHRRQIFTKWVEAKPIRKCDGKTSTKFLRELIYCYGYPHNIITDNDTNFAKGEMVEFCEENGIRLDLASVTHPESNGQAEQANQSILHGIKPRQQVSL
jgi:hypothetical protein